MDGSASSVARPEVAHFAFLNYLGGAVAAAYAVYQDSWPGLGFISPILSLDIALSLVVSIITAMTIEGGRNHLAVCPAVRVPSAPGLWAWRQELARANSGSAFESTPILLDNSACLVMSLTPPDVDRRSPWNCMTLWRPSVTIRQGRRPSPK